MKIHRFYIENIDIDDQNKIVTHETNLIHQLKNVFRYKTGQIINIFNEKVGEIEVEILDINKKDMSFNYKRHLNNNVLTDKKNSLYMSVIKNSNFDLIIEKSVELNIANVIPVLTDRTIKNNLNYERLNKIVKESTEQSGRLDLMHVENILTLEESIEHAVKNNDVVYFGSLDKGVDFVSKKDSINNVAVFIGPEGGYSEKEINLFKNKNILPINLGKNVLRAETAAILACGLISINH